MAKLSPKERRTIPTCFHWAPPHYTNHLELAVFNTLATDVGLVAAIYDDIEVLPKDTGERFFSEYLKEQLKRDEDGVSHDDVTRRYLCKACGGRNLYARGADTLWGRSTA